MITYTYQNLVSVNRPNCTLSLHINSSVTYESLVNYILF